MSFEKRFRKMLREDIDDLKTSYRKGGYDKRHHNAKTGSNRVHQNFIPVVHQASATDNKNVELIPQSLLSNLSAGNKIKVTVTRKAATGQDNSDRNSVVLKNINVKLNRATAPVKGSANKFSIQ